MPDVLARTARSRRYLSSGVKGHVNRTVTIAGAHRTTGTCNNTRRGHLQTSRLPTATNEPRSLRRPSPYPAVVGGGRQRSALAREMRPILPALGDLTSWLNQRVVEGPTAGSLLALEIDEQRRSTEAGEQAALSSVASEALVALTWSACGHLDGLRRLLGSSDEVPHPHALVSLARGAIENAALATWLADSGVNGVERGRRFASYQRHGLTEHAKLGLGSAGLQPAVADLDATAAGPGWELVLPSKTKLVALLYGDAKVDPVDAFGAFGYRVLSAIAHGSFHTLLEFFHPVDDGSGVVGASAQQAFSMCVLPAVTAIQLFGYQLVATFGLSTVEWGQIIRRCREVDVTHLMPP